MRYKLGSKRGCLARGRGSPGQVGEKQLLHGCSSLYLSLSLCLCTSILSFFYLLSPRFSSRELRIKDDGFPSNRETSAQQSIVFRPAPLDDQLERGVRFPPREIVPAASRSPIVFERRGILLHLFVLFSLAGAVAVIAVILVRVFRTARQTCASGARAGGD